MKTTDYEYLLSVLDKAENGLFIEEKVWDQQYINKKVRELIEKYDIVWDKETMIPDDDALADRLFEAGMEFARESGVYCINSSRQMVWSQDELDDVLEKAPQELTVGEGQDKSTITSRRPEEASLVTVIGGAYGTLIPEDLFIPMVISYAKEPLLNIIEPPSLPTTRGRSIRISSPWEAIVGWQEAEMVFEAISQAGRQGICVGAAATSGTEIIELASTTYGAFRQTDWHHASFVSENKVSYADLTRAVHFAHTGSIAHAFCVPIYGGYLGGSFGVAVGSVAGCVLLRACLFADVVNAAPCHAHLSCNSHPAMISAQALAFQALSRNTHLLNAAHIRPASGPCVKDIFYECAALAIAGVTSGADCLKMVQSATGRHMGHTTPLEARFCAQVAHAVEGMTRKEADFIVRRLIEKYQDGLKAEQIGKPFHEAYNLDTLEPTEEWQRLYEQACQEFKVEFGLLL